MTEIMKMWVFASGYLSGIDGCSGHGNGGKRERK